MAAITDPIADMLTRIRNGLRARHPRVDMPSAKLKVEVARILKEEGYIANYKVADEGKKKVLRVFLRYTPEGESVITTLDGTGRKRSPKSRPKITSATGRDPPCPSRIDFSHAVTTC